MAAVASLPSAPILNLFWDLASTDETKRLDASSSLVNILSQSQAAHEAVEKYERVQLAKARDAGGSALRDRLWARAEA